MQHVAPALQQRSPEKKLRWSTADDVDTTTEPANHKTASEELEIITAEQ